MPLLPDLIHFSETMEASPAELIEAVREQGFEGIVAKRRDSLCKPGQRSAAWQKMRVLQGRDFVIGGYTPVGRNFDAILVDYYEGRALMFVGKVRAGFTPALRASVFPFSPTRLHLAARSKASAMPSRSYPPVPSSFRAVGTPATHRWASEAVPAVRRAPRKWRAAPVYLQYAHSLVAAQRRARCTAPMSEP